ncbi:MAG: DUF371 domain-containing protein [Candidatus Aenigmatarchaeota archaeon]|nr:DUF371 domain-containing protein [Candidatus Aenigmarchaeota archaeon]
MILEEIIAFGHEKVLAKHKTTIEITRENFLTKNGDCIIAVNANKSCFDLNENLKSVLKSGEKIIFEIEVNGKKDKITAFGSNQLDLSNKTSIVIRKSNYIDDRTIAINADKAACNIRRDIIEELKNPKAKLILRVIK